MAEIERRRTRKEGEKHRRIALAAVVFAALAAGASMIAAVASLNRA